MSSPSTTTANRVSGDLQHRDVFAGMPDLDTAPLALIIDLIRRGRANTRPALTELSGLSRKVVTQRVEQALQLGLLQDGPLAPSAGGRQARTLRFPTAVGHVYSALVGASEFRCAILDLSGNIVASSHEDWSVGHGPEATMERIHHHFLDLAGKTGIKQPWGIGMGVPGPVDIRSGTIVAPPIMPGWDRFNPRAWLRAHYDAPVWVDNDCNLMALGEWSRLDSTIADMLFIKIGTGVGAGVIVDGKVLRGARGAAGDIGHTHVTDDPTAVCRCGRIGCLEAIASGWSLLEEATLRAAESPHLSSVLERGRTLALGDIGQAARHDDSLVLELLDRCADQIATVTANLANFTNPATVVIGGGVLQTGLRFVDRIRERVFQLCSDLVTTDLTVRPSLLEPIEGIIGAGLLASERLLSPAALSHWAQAGTPTGRGAAIQGATW